MGSLQAAEMRDSLGLSRSLSWFFQSNHYPPMTPVETWVKDSQLALKKVRDTAKDFLEQYGWMPFDDLCQLVMDHGDLDEPFEETELKSQRTGKGPTLREFLDAADLTRGGYTYVDMTIAEAYADLGYTECEDEDEE